MEYSKGQDIKNILVTGGRGFVGSYLIRELEQRNFFVSCFDIKEGFDITKMTHPVGVYDAIINLAAVSNVKEAEENPEEAYAVNVNAVQRLKDIYPNTYFIHFSSSCVGLSNLVYAKTKEAGEKFMTDKDLILRPTNIFGYGALDTHVIPSFIRSILYDYPVHITGDGKQKRDFIYVKDVVNEVISHLFCQTKGVRYLGSGKEISIIELCDKISSILGKEFNPVFCEERGGEFYSNKSKDKLFSPATDFDVALEETIEEYEKYI